jgi:hypothetical protein
MIIRSNDVAERPGSMQSRVVLALVVTAAVVVYACNSGPTPPTNPPQSPPGGGTPNTPGGTSNSVKPGVTTLCKHGPGGRFLVSVGATGTNPTTKTVTVDDGQCVDVANVDPASKDDVIVAIAENAVAFAAIDHIVMQHGEDAARTMTRTSTVSFEGSHGAIVTYQNNAVVTLCKVGLTGTFQYQVGPADTFHDLSLTGGQCSTIATIPPAAMADDVIVTIRENASASYRLDHVAMVLGDADPAAPRTLTGSSTVSFEGVHGAVITFFNVAP